MGSILFNSTIVPPYMLSLFDKDAHFFCDFFKLRFHIIPDIKVKKYLKLCSRLKEFCLKQG
jgi:hypothetical protein